MSSPHDEQGLDLFEETASAAGNFPLSLRGYERATVDAYVRELEAKLSRALAELRDTRYRLSAAATSVDTTDYSRLGGHARALLKSAEAQAAEIVQTARAEADRIRAEAGAERVRATNEVNLALDASRATSLADIDQVRQLLGAQTAAELEAAREDAAALRQATEQHREWLLREGETQARAIIDAAVAEAEQRRAQLERVTADQAAELARVRENALTEIAAVRQTAVEQVAELIATARRQADDQRTRLEADLLTADQRREAARAEAAEITRAAAEQAQLALETARHEATRITTEANREAAEAAERLAAEVESLTTRKQAILDQLEQLSSLAIDSAQQYDGAAEPQDDAALEPTDEDAPAEAADPEPDGALQAEVPAPADGQVPADDSVPQPEDDAVPQPEDDGPQPEDAVPEPEDDSVPQPEDDATPDSGEQPAEPQPTEPAEASERP